MTQGFPHLPNNRLDNYHKYVGSFLMILGYATYFAACWTGPGRIDKNSSKDDVDRAVKRFKCDGVIFEKGV